MIKSILINAAILFVALFGVYMGYSTYSDFRTEQRNKIILDAKLELLNNQTSETTINAGANLANRVPEKVIEVEDKVDSVEIEIPKTEELAQKEIPESYDNTVVFHSQSPFGTWGPVFGETCEEASALLAVNYFENKEMDATKFRDTLLDMVEWQKQRFGKFEHTNVEETGIILKEYFGYNDFMILDEPTVLDMKTELSKGNLIIAPFYGVGMNPNYSDGGPPYHFIMIKGYTPDTFISHDVGTKRGENYSYPITELMDRLHDYNAESIQLGEKKLIVVRQKS